MSCNVYQYFGEKLTPSGWEFYYTDADNINKPNFDCSILKESLGINFDSFTLTELELLSCSNLNSWLSYCARRHADGETELLGIKLMENLMGADFNAFVDTTTKFFEQLNNESDSKAVTEALSKSTKYDARAKLEIGRVWLSKLYSSYYGRQYLVQVGNSSVGVCIKDRYGNVPSGNIKVESEGGIFYSSDTPSTAGGWLGRSQNSVMGLSIGPELYAFTEGDGRIGAFVQYVQSSNISKYGLVWDIDLSGLGDDGWYKENSNIWLKATINPALYRINGNQYVLITIDGEAGLIFSKNSSPDCEVISDFRGAQSVLLLHGVDISSLKRMTGCLNDDKSGSGVGFNNLNNLDYNKPRISPENFCIPFKSNVFTYGPWFFQANPVGGTDVETNTELSPWNFSNLQNSGYDTMNYYGGLIASDGPRGLQQQESGSITVASLPSYGIGYIVGGNAATLTDLQINISDSGYTTTYNFQTYTPKFGKPGRHLNDLWKRNYKSMAYLNKYFKDQALEIRALINQTQAEIQKESRKMPKNPGTATDVGVEKPAAGTNSSNSPIELLFSKYTLSDKITTYDGGTDTFDNSPGAIPQPCSGCEETPPPSTSLTSSTSTAGNNIKIMPQSFAESSLENIWNRPDFNRFAFNSWDLIFLPICTYQTGDAGTELPRLALYQSYDGSFGDYSYKSTTQLGDGKAPNSRTRSEIPPFFIDEVLQYDLPINQMYLNPVTSRAMLSQGNWPNIRNDSTMGFVVNVISHGNDPKNFSLISNTTNENNVQNSDHFRYSALRGPLSLQSWGYDTSGKPIPNAIDSAQKAEQGRFRRRGLQDKFLKDWLANPKTWPVGPIDLRWDRERGVWVAPPSNKIVVAKLLTNLEKFGMAEAELIDPVSGGIRFYEEYDIWSNQGANVKGSMHKAKIKVYDFLGIKLCKCDYIYAYYDDNRYIVLESNRAYKDPNESCCPTTGPTTAPTQPSQTQPTQPTPTSCWCNLECLKTLSNFKEGKHQALVHKQETNGPDCLVWEDIVECNTPPPNFYNNP